VVEAKESPPGVKRLVAYVIRRQQPALPASEQAGITISELRRFLKQSLPQFMLPVSCVVMDAFPLTANGKLDRKALPDPDEHRPELAAQYAAPRNKLESDLTQAWAATLKLDRVGINDNFFDLGGASLTSLEVTSRLSEAGIRITPEMIFAHQTVAELAVAIESSVTPVPQTQPDEVIDRTRELPLRTDAKPAGMSEVVKRGNVVIESLGVYLPSKSVSTDEVLAGCRNRVLFPLERMTGIKSRRVAAENEFSIDLAKAAVVDCLRKSKYRPEQIELLICCNVSRYDGLLRFSYEPSTSVRLRSFFGLSNALVFDISNACAGMFTAIMICDALIKNGAVGSAMVVSGECISHLTRTAQHEIDGFMDSRLACLTVGDAGAAVIVEKSPSHDVGFQDIDMYTLGKYSPLCIAKMTDGDHPGAIMYTDSITQTAVASRNAVMHSADIMQRCGWSAESVDRLIMHQTSETSLRDVVRALNEAFGKPACHDGNVVYNLAERGNTATTTHFVALEDTIQKGKMKSGERVVFGISASGQTVGTALYICDDLPERLRQFESGETVSGIPAKSDWKPTRPKQLLPRVKIASIGILPRDDHELDRSAINMARWAAEDCLQNSPYSREDIELLIHAGVYRDEFLAEPAQAALLAGELRMNEDIVSIADKKTFVFDVCNGAVGFLDACYVASQLIQSQRYRNAMIVTAEIENNSGAYPRRGVQETGSAVILHTSDDPRTGFGHFVFECRPEYLDAISTYTARDDSRTILRIEEDERIHDLFLRCIPAAIERLLESEGLNASQITIVLGPQISGRLHQSFEQNASDQPRQVRGYRP
jgi:3-oxoacyl-[acyl-carrier-protein] synthase III